MQVSHSRVECYNNCPYKYKLRYIDGLETVKNQDANNALYLGSGIHKGIEEGLKAGIKEYLDNYYVINDLNINEIMKYEYLIPIVRALIAWDFNKFEVLVENDDFKGFIDLLYKNPDGTYNILDFKYSNNLDKYMESPQLHLYKYYYEKITGNAVKGLYYLMIPKVQIRQKKTEDLYQFRKRLQTELFKSDIRVVPVEYNPEKINGFLADKEKMLNDKKYEKNESYLCKWCEYENYCLKGVDYMILPKNERRETVVDTKPDMWIYADSYVGKSTFIDKIDNLLFINTDGNTDNTTSPVIRIADEVETEGRLVKRTLAWDVFLEAVAELEKKENDFKAVAIDLVEDLYEHCRLYMYDKLGIEHEQDAGFGKGWDMVKTEFLSTMKRLKNLGYQIIYISKESATDINLKNGGKITTVKPNINEKVANVLAGTVDLTVRAYLDGHDRKLLLDKKENIFGGGRFNFKADVINLDMDEFKQALIDAQGDKKVKKYEKPVVEEVKQEPKDKEHQRQEIKQDKEEIKQNQQSTTTENEQPTRTRRTRRTRNSNEGEN